MDKHIQQQHQQHDEEKEEGFTVVPLDESFFFYDSLVMRVCWIEENKRPLVRITGSHKHTCIWSSKHGWKKTTIQTV